MPHLSARYNGLLAALDARYFDLWSQYWHRLEAMRTAGAATENRLVREMLRVEAVRGGGSAAIHPQRPGAPALSPAADGMGR